MIKQEWKRAYQGWSNNQEPSGGDMGKHAYARTTRQKHPQRARDQYSKIVPARLVIRRLEGLEWTGGCQRYCLTTLRISSVQLAVHSKLITTVENGRTYLDRRWAYIRDQGCVRALKLVTYERLRCLNPLVRPPRILEVLEFVPGMQN